MAEEFQFSEKFNYNCRCCTILKSFSCLFIQLAIYSYFVNFLYHMVFIQARFKSRLFDLRFSGSKFLIAYGGNFVYVNFFHGSNFVHKFLRDLQSFQVVSKCFWSIQ